MKYYILDYSFNKEQIKNLESKVFVLFVRFAYG